VSNNVLLQNPRDFTVQIRHATTDEIVGTGIVVSTDGKIVTCAHVVHDAGVNPHEADSGEVTVYFPKLGNRAAEARRASVVACFHDHEDDVVLMSLLGGSAPRSSEQVAVLGTSELSRRNEFESYGYRRLEDYAAGLAGGTIQGIVEPPEGRNVQADPVQLKSSQINLGMSGAGVLDLERNLVVGVISETWFPDLSTKDRDTAWAVDACVLGFNPLNLPLRDESLPLREAPQQREYVAVGLEAQEYDPLIALRAAPAPLPDEEWVGRDDLLGAISADWTDPGSLVTGLIGFGGEGKSSLVRKWLDMLLADPVRSQPDDLFWWDFHANPSVDAFLGAAVAYLGGEKLAWNARESSVRVNVISSLLQQPRHFLFVLDGLESVQHSEGDDYGLVQSQALKRLLELLALPGHQSFCIITSRAPVLDLVHYKTYVHRNVGPLSLVQGRALLRKLGVNGPDAALDQVVGAWEGHALTLSLLGSYLTERHGGNIAHVDEIPTPASDESRYKRVRLMLQHYDEQLSDAERAFLKLLSAFRTPVDQRAFARVFRSETDADSLNAPILTLDDAGFDELLNRLSTYRILRQDMFSNQYTAHPLIREYFYMALTDEQRRSVHYQLKDFYLVEASISRGMREQLEDILGTELPPFGWLRFGDNEIAADERLPLFEAVHHACRAGDYDEAYEIYYQGAHEGDWTLVRQLGAYGTDLWLLGEFFEDGDFEREPQVSDIGIRSRLINQVGFDYQALGKLSDAVRFFQRAVQIDREMGDLANAFSALANQSEALIQVGDLDRVQGVVEELTELARQIRHRPGHEKHDDEFFKLFEMMSLALAAWVAHLRGDRSLASRLFEHAEILQVEREPHVNYLYSTGGIWHASHLIALEDLDYAEAITNQNLIICEYAGFVHNIAACQRLMGDIARIRQNFDSAHEWYDAAIDVLQRIGLRYELASSLLSRGLLWLAEGEFQRALDDLTYALDLSKDFAYRLIESDLCIALSRLHLFQGRTADAEAEAQCALTIAQETGYHWALAAAEETLADLERRTDLDLGPGDSP